MRRGCLRPFVRETGSRGGLRVQSGRLRTTGNGTPNGPKTAVLGWFPLPGVLVRMATDDLPPHRSQKLRNKKIAKDGLSGVRSRDLPDERRGFCRYAKKGSLICDMFLVPRVHGGQGS